MSTGPTAHATVARADFAPLLTLARGGAGPASGGPSAAAPLFCVHPAAGVGWEYASLARHLDGRALHALQARGLAEPAPPPGSVREIAEDYLTLVRREQPAGPYCLLGWSFGGAVAHEMATRLREQGEQVALLAILDWYPYDPDRPEDEPGEHEYLLTLLENLGCDQDRIRRAAGWPVDRDGARRALLARGHVLDFLPDERLEAILQVFLHNVALRRTHRPERFDGPLLFFTAAAEPGAAPGRAEAAWRPYTAGPVRNHDIEVEHRRMLQQSSAALIGPVLARALALGDPARDAAAAEPATTITATDSEEGAS